MNLFLHAYEIDEQIADISEDRLSAFVVLNKAAIPGSVKIVADGEDIALELDELGGLFNYFADYERPNSNRLKCARGVRSEVNHKTREVIMTFEKPVAEVKVQYFYIPEEDSFT